MIKLAKLTDYAFIILTEMARSDAEKVSAALLAEKTGVSEPTVAKIMKILAKNDVLNSIRGAKGGYVLAHELEAISLARIVEIMEGPIALTSCTDNSHDQCHIEMDCPLKGRWNPVNIIIQTTLERITLAELASFEKETTLSKVDTIAEEVTSWG